MKQKTASAVFRKSAGASRAFDTKTKRCENQNFHRASARQPFQAQPDKGMPRLERIIEEVNKVLFEDKSPKEAVNELMLRVGKAEHTALPWE